MHSACDGAPRASYGPRRGASVLLAAGSTLAFVAMLAWWHRSPLTGALKTPQSIGAAAVGVLRTPATLQLLAACGHADLWRKLARALITEQAVAGASIGFTVLASSDERVGSASHYVSCCHYDVGVC